MSELGAYPGWFGKTPAMCVAGRLQAEHFLAETPQISRMHNACVDANRLLAAVEAKRAAG